MLNRILHQFRRDSLRHRLSTSLGLKKRRKGSSKVRRGYMRPDWWLEGEVREVMVTFWGDWTDDTFTGEMVLGPGDANTINSAGRETDGKLHALTEKGDRSPALAPVQRTRALLEAHATLTSYRYVIDGAEFVWRAAREPEIREVLEAGVASVLAIQALPVPPLLAAVEAGDRQEVERLLQAGANPDEFANELMVFGGAVRDTLRHRPLLAAIRRNDVAMVELLLRHGADWKTNPGWPFLVALREGANEALAALVKAGLPAEWQNWDRTRDDMVGSVQLAARTGNLAAIRMLLAVDAERTLFSREMLRAAKRDAAGPGKRALRELLQTEAMQRPDLSDWAKVTPRRFARVAGSQTIAAGAAIGLALVGGQSPRAAVYGFFVHTILRLATVAGLLRLHTRGPARWRGWIARVTRPPHPDQPASPVTVDTGRGPVPAALAGYLTVMALLFGLIVLLTNTRDQQIVMTWAAFARDAGQAVGFAVLWWVQDLLGRRNVLCPGAPVQLSLAFNSDETGVAALTVLIGGTISAVSGSPWGAFIALLCFKALMEATAELRWPAPDAA